MLVPIEWLKQFVKTDKSDEEIADILTLSGTNIDSVDNGILDAEITANRGDCLSIYGIARELAAMSNLELEPLEIPNIKSGNESLIKPQIIDPETTYRYAGYVIKGITQKESPEWVQKRLIAAGMRPINNIVDVTNYIMIETGQPLHAFDVDKIVNGEMIIRKAKSGEKVTTLDNAERELDENSIIIESNGQLIDLAGIMGGAKSEVSESTKNIFLQSAIFNPIMIRRTSKKTKVSTEASYRYERGVDMDKAKDYGLMAAEMIIELGGGEIAQEIDIYPNPLQEFPIIWDRKKGEKLLGVDIDMEKSIADLEKIGIKTKHRGSENYEAIAPSWRMDLCLPEDIYEEIVRFYPVNELPRTKLKSVEPSQNLANYSFIEHIKDQLFEDGLTEIYGYSFVSKKELEKANLETSSSIKIGNPLSEEHQYLRPSLLIDMLTAVFRNPSFDPVAIFEIGHTFTKDGEKNLIGIMIAGRGAKYLENVVDKLQEEIDSKTDYQVVDIPQELLAKFKVRKAVVRFVEIDIDELKANSKKTEFEYQLFEMNQKYEPIAKFPSVNRDIAIIVEKSIDPQEILSSIKNTDNLVRNVELFDTFESDKLGIGKKSLAYHIHYQSDEKTLEDTQINELHDKVVNNLEEKYQAKLR